MVLQELVQVESLAQVGVQLLLFTLGLEFSLQKLRAVRSVALIGQPPLFFSRNIIWCWSFAVDSMLIAGILKLAVT